MSEEIGARVAEILKQSVPGYSQDELVRSNIQAVEAFDFADFTQEKLYAVMALVAAALAAAIELSYEDATRVTAQIMPLLEAEITKK